MSQICIINNALDGSDQYFIETDSILYTFLQYKSKYPQALIFKGNPCPENNVTPTGSGDKQAIARLMESNDDCTIVLYSGDLISAVNWVVGKVIGAGISALVKVPKVPLNNAGTSTGSSNNNLSDRENRQRLKQRVPFILGRVKCIPDLFAPVVRYFKDDVEVEETLMCLCENHVQVSQFKEGDTPVQEISGTSVTAYGIGQSLIGTDNIFKWGYI